MSSIAVKGADTGTGVFTIESPATNTDFASRFDYVDGKLYWKANANQKVRFKEAGFVTKKGYRKVEFDGRKYGTHQIVFALHHGYIPNAVDHINTDKLDNRIENLREADRCQNGYNRGMTASNTSGIKNVAYRADSDKWRVTLRVDGRTKSFGSYFDIELAELVSFEARDKWHGEYANHGGSL